MNHRFFLVLALTFALLAGRAFAGTEIRKARYGNETISRDVRGIIEAYLRNNTLTFPVNARTMGGDPNPKQPDYLSITYAVDEREYSEAVPDGGVFTFKGLGNLQTPRPFFPLFKPSGPGSAPLVIVNRSEGPAAIYGIDRYGQWVWTASLSKGQTLTLTGQVGQHWLATDESNRVLARTRISRGDNLMWVTAPEDRPPPGGFRGEEAWIRFENTSYKSIYLYNLDSLGRWNWMATLEPGGGYSASTHVGESWIATETSNRLIRQVTVAPGLSHVKLF